MDIDDAVARISAAGVGASGVFALVDADDAEIRFAVVDDRVPGGGYVKGFPLMTGQTYLIVSISGQLTGVERGMNVPKSAAGLAGKKPAKTAVTKGGKSS